MGYFGDKLEKGYKSKNNHQESEKMIRGNDSFKKKEKNDFLHAMEQTEWLEKIFQSYKSGVTNQFFLTGNIYDFAFEHYNLKPFLVNIAKNEEFFNFNEIYSFGVNGLENIIGPEVSDHSFDGLIDFLNEGDNGQPKLFIVEYPEYIISGGENISNDDMQQNIKMHAALKSIKMRTSSNMIIFLAETTKDIHPMFLQNQSQISVVDIPYPNEEQRLDFIEYLINEDSELSREDSYGYKDLFKDFNTNQFARMSAGLTLLNIENILMQASYDGLLDANTVFNKKRSLIRKEFGEIIEIFDSNGLTLDNFAGQDNIKNYHKEMIIEPILDGNTSMVPKGLLYVGPPGTGKTYFANCLAGSAKINFVEFKMSKILDVYVGQAEKNLERALKCFESLAPVGVFIDEVEQVLSRGGENDNHVVKNIFSMFLSFLSNPKHRGKIIWIGATNYPNMLDEALKRPGRFDKKIPFFPPEENDRKSILNLHLNKHGIYNAQTEQVVNNSDFILLTEGYSQAEIENVVIKVVELMYRQKKSSLDSELLNLAINSIKSSKSKEKIKEMIDIAIEECNDKEFLPEKYMN